VLVVFNKEERKLAPVELRYYYIFEPIKEIGASIAATYAFPTI
jgi:hypothetical protein